jgi:hypothetical protein
MVVLPPRYPSAKGVIENPSHGLLNHLRGTPLDNGFGSASTAEEVSARGERVAPTRRHANGTCGIAARPPPAQVSEGWDGTGQVAIVTGASSGLGAESARVLAARGCEVVMAVRSLAKCDQVRGRGKEPATPYLVGQPADPPCHKGPVTWSWLCRWWRASGPSTQRRV